MTTQKKNEKNKTTNEKPKADLGKQNAKSDANNKVIKPILDDDEDFDMPLDSEFGLDEIGDFDDDDDF